MKKDQFINVGFGKEISIKELAILICKIANYSGKIEYDKTKSNGSYRKLIGLLKFHLKKVSNLLLKIIKIFKCRKLFQIFKN